MAFPRHTYLLLLLCCLLHHTTAQPTAAPATTDAEKQLLLQIKQAWGDPAVLASWDGTASASHCNWTYVKCDAAGRVASLSLPNASVTGPVPDAIGGLRSLTTLDLSVNYLNATFPAFLYNCTALQYLDLSTNNLFGELPANIGRLGKNLTTLVLSKNYFNGTIPTSLCQLQNLQKLTLDNNRLGGTIPAVLGQLTNLRVLFLGYNNFGPGELPGSFKNLRKLTALSVVQCNLTGDFPSYVTEMPDMEMLDLAVNAFTGSIPPGLWSLEKLQHLTIFANNFSGHLTIDRALGAAGLVLIDMSSNNLSGAIPESFGSLKNLTALNLYFNNFSGEIPASIGRLPSLETLMLFNNRLTGVLPPELGRHSSGLQKVEVDDNDISGPIPAGLCDNRQFQALTASSNSLNGSIPASLAGCATLNNLILDNNLLSGEVPRTLWTATQLTTVHLSNNKLSGSFPGEMYSNLSQLNIENNQFSGSIPTTAVALQVLIAGNNEFSGDVPAEMAAGMLLLQRLNLSGNQLSGSIPESIGALKELTQLDFSNNKLTGKVPAEVGSIPVLNVLDLSSNRLSGDIPLALGRLNLNTLNLSSNMLSGQVPAALAITAYDRSFLDNPGLCTTAAASMYLAGVPSCSAGRSSSSSGGVSPALRSGLLAAGSVLLLAIAAFAVFVVRDIKRRKRLAQRKDWKLTPFQALDFSEAAVLRGLTEENVIGRGGSGRVYRVTYTNRYNGNTGAMAVKRIRSSGKLDEKLEREYEAEVDVLGSLRHINIVKLLCCISSSESKLLVYQYMDNGSLDKWLHGHKLPSRPGTARVHSVRRAPLDWPTRVRIAVGAAQGLCYMHHECSPPIVHRDVKSSNILLDSEFQAKVADFGLARMLVQAGTSETASAVAGSFGYMAPECAYTRKVNEKVDVYSFGVVLLELTTGREANDGGEHGCLVEWAQGHLQLGASVADVTDKCISGSGYSDEIECVFKLGVICTGALPATRPTMKDVLQILLRCEQVHQKSERRMDYEAAPLLPARGGSRRKQLSDTKGADDGDGVLDCDV